MLMTHRFARARPLAPLLLAAVSLSVPLAVPEAGLAKQMPKTTKVRHVGSFDGMPGSQVRFTLVKKGSQLLKAVDIRVSGVVLQCSEGQGGRSTTTYSTAFPDASVRSALGTVGFALSEMRLREFEWGYTSFVGFPTHRGKRATGDSRIRWDHGGRLCDTGTASWTSRPR
jgi:hypothetical protein